MDSKTGTPAANIYYDGENQPKYFSEILKQIKKPANVSYIMDNGTSIYYTHEYCYLSYLKIDLGGEILKSDSLFNSTPLEIVIPTIVPPMMIEAAKMYLTDRRNYLGFLN